MTEDYDGADVRAADGDKIGTVERTFIDGSGASRYVEVRIGTLLAKHRLVPLDGAQASGAALQVPYSKRDVEHSPDVSGIADEVDSETLDRIQSYYGGSGATDDAVDSEDPSGTAEAEEPVAETDRPDEDAPGAVPAAEDAVDEDVPVARSEADVVENRRPAAEVASATPVAVTGDGEADFGQIRDLGDVIEVPIVEERLVKVPVVTQVLRVRKTANLETQVVDGDVRREDIETISERDADNVTDNT